MYIGIFCEPFHLLSPTIPQPEFLRICLRVLQSILACSCGLCNVFVFCFTFDLSLLFFSSIYFLFIYACHFQLPLPPLSLLLLRLFIVISRFLRYFKSCIDSILNISTLTILLPVYICFKISPVVNNAPVCILAFPRANEHVCALENILSPGTYF